MSLFWILNVNFYQLTQIVEMRCLNVYDWTMYQTVWHNWKKEEKKRKKKQKNK